MPEIHATLSASSAHRWLECTAAPSLEATVPAGTAVSEAALEGTEAHSMAEAKLRAALEGRPGPETTDNAEMEECTDAYVSFVLDAAKALSPLRSPWNSWSTSVTWSLAASEPLTAS